MNKILLSVSALSLWTCHSLASASTTFSDGPLIKGFGQHAPVQQSTPLNQDTSFHVAFDVGKQADVGQINRKFDTLARFLNMHVANGVKPENIQLALVVHGKAGRDLLNDATYLAKHGVNNPNTPLLVLLTQHNTRIYICGQSATFAGIEPQQLNDQVSVALSAMTAHALLQQQGYTLNPF